MLQSHAVHRLGHIIPRDFLNNLPNKRSPLAQMTFASRDAWLNFAEGGFLFVDVLVSPVFTSTPIISTRCRQGRLTWPRFNPIAIPERSFAILGGLADERFRDVVVSWFVVFFGG